GSKDRARGNSALKGALDAEYAVVKSDDEVKITAKKMKDADEPEPVNFLFDPVRLPFMDDDGEPQYSCVLSYFDKNADMLAKREEAQEKSAEAGRRQAEINIGQKQIEIIKILNKQIVCAKAVLAGSGRDPALARIEIRNLKDAATEKGIVPKKNWSRTFTALVERGFLEVDEPFVTITQKGRDIVFGADD
ncbi:hypothetical protein, partial [Endozoicomonas atrinae]|uniref:hypothetical protein n=1 Tax=Endozoicomonas atrinae TaxID=1333660 RepID=UPI000B172A6C